MNLFNIGVEGQYRVASSPPPPSPARRWLPGLLNIFVAARRRDGRRRRCGPASPACCKVTRGVSEVISTIMLNAIAGIADRLPARHVRRARRQLRPAPSRSRRAPRSAAGSPFARRPERDLGLSRARGPRRRRLLGAAEQDPVRLRPARDRRVRRPPRSPAASTCSRMVVVSMLLSGGVAGLIWTAGVLRRRLHLRHDVPGRARLHRHRGGAAGSQPPGRHRLRRAALRVPQRAGQPADHR